MSTYSRAHPSHMLGVSKLLMLWPCWVRTTCLFFILDCSDMFGGFSRLPESRRRFSAQTEQEPVAYLLWAIREDGYKEATCSAGTSLVP